MKRIATAALSLLVMGAMASPVMAQSDVGAPLGSLYLSPSSNEYVPFMQSIPLFTSQTIYVVADIDFGDIGRAEQNATNGIRAWEAGFTKPAAMNFITVTTTPAGLTNFGNSTNYILGIGGVLTASTMPRPLLQLDFILLAAIPAPGFEMTLGAVSGFPQTVPGQAVWQEQLTLNGCTNRVTGNPERCFFPFATLGKLTVSTGITNDESSWGELKKGY